MLALVSHTHARTLSERILEENPSMEALRCQSVAALSLCRPGFRNPSLFLHGRRAHTSPHEQCSRSNPAAKNANLHVGGAIGDTNSPSTWKRCVEAGPARASQPKERELKKVCVRCGTPYRDTENSPVACKYHGHMTGDQGMYALAPPHQGIDGEWTDASGVIVYKWNEEGERPSTGSKNWKRRWTCCGVYDEKAAPCRVGRHVSYDDGATRF